MGRLFYVMQCDDEESVSIVWDSDMVCEDDVAIGDKAIFFYEKKQYIGKVRFISEDYQKCVKKQKEVYAELRGALRKEKSFHRENPRTAAVRNREKLMEAGVLPRKGSSQNQRKKPFGQQNLRDEMEERTNQEIAAAMKKKGTTIYSSSEDEGESSRTNSKNKSKTILSKVLGEDDNSDQDASINEDGLDDTLEVDKDTHAAYIDEDEKSLDEDPIRIKTKVLRDLEKFSIEDLQRMIGQKRAEAEQRDDSCVSQPTKKRAIAPSQGRIDITPTKRLPAKAAPKGNTKKGVGSLLARMKYTRNFTHVYKGNMFLCSGDDEEDVLLLPNKKFYIKEGVLEWAKGSTTASMMARRLLEGVFTLEALQNCSLTALPPRCKGRDAYKDGKNIKKMLDPYAVEAILKFVLNYQKEQKWSPKQDETKIRQKIAGRLCELASEARMNDRLGGQREEQ